MTATNPKDYDALTECIIRRDLRRDSCCIDVGCHSGEILDMMLSVAKDGKFYCFEPIPHLAAGLRVQYPGSNFHIFEIALSDKIGSATFNYVKSNPGYSGLLKRRYDNPSEIDEEITVKTDTLDNVIGEAHVDFIKIDVEGAEMQVLRGARELIKRERPIIVFEHGLGASDIYGTTPEMVFDLLSDELGMQLYHLHEYIEAGDCLDKALFCKSYYTGEHYYFMGTYGK